MTPSVFLLALVSISLNAFAQIALRKTMLSIGSLSTAGGLLNFGSSLLLSPWFIGGIFCYVLSVGIWMAVLGRVEVSLAYPLLSIGYIITATIAYFFLKEDLNAMRIIGIACICVGIIFISRSG